jgi:GNAT superfamily N-acetyltransferase
VTFAKINPGYQASRLKGGGANLFEPFLLPGLTQIFAQLETNPRVVAIGAWHGEIPVGLALAEINAKDPRTARLLSINAASAHRRLGVGSRLMSVLEEELLAADCMLLEAMYPDEKSEARPIEHFLLKSGWTPARPFHVVCKAWVARLVQARWTRVPYPDYYQIFRWRHLTPADRDEIIQSQETRLRFPPHLNPFKDEDRLNLDASLGLRVNGRVIGWCLAKHYSSDTLWVDNLFAAPETRLRGRAAPLAGAFLQRLMRTNIHKVAWEVDRFNKAAVRFNAKHLEPWSLSIRTTTHTFKLLVEVSLSDTDDNPK